MANSKSKKNSVKNVKKDNRKSKIVDVKSVNKKKITSENRLIDKSVFKLLIIIFVVVLGLLAYFQTFSAASKLATRYHTKYTVTVPVQQKKPRGKAGDLNYYLDKNGCGYHTMYMALKLSGVKIGSSGDVFKAVNKNWKKGRTAKKYFSGNNEWMTSSESISYAKKKGIFYTSAKNSSLTEEKLKNYLAANRMILLCQKSYKYGSGGNHWILLVKNSTGKYYVANSSIKGTDHTQWSTAKLSEIVKFAKANGSESYIVTKSK